MKRKQKRILVESIQIIIILAIVAAFIFGNIQYTRNNPGGNDFLVHWIGNQSFINDGISPYSDEVALSIQNSVYGRPAEPGEHELRVAYPFYSILLFFPFALIKDFTVARALWMTLLEFLVIISTFMMVKLVNWKPKILISFLLTVFGLFWYHGLRAIINGNAVIVILFLVILSIYAIMQKQDELAGISLGLMTIKPQVIVIYILFVMFWAFSNKKFKLIFWFVGSFFAFVLVGLFLLPNWPLDFLREVIRYPGYNPPGTPATALAALLPGIGQRLGIIISVLSGIVLIVEWFLGRHSRENKFIWVVSLTLVLGQWVNIQTDPGNFVIMFPALILIFRMVEDRWKNLGHWILIGYLTLIFFIPWILFIRTIDFGYQPIQSPVMFFPVPIMIIIGLYWVRWWVENPVKNILNS